MNLLKKFKSLFSPMDLTSGNIFKTITLFTVPIFLCILFQQIYSLTDTIICGQFLSSNEVSGIGDAGSITFLLLEFAIGCAGGFSVVIAKKIGEKNLNDSRKTFWIQLLLTFIISAVLTLLFIFLIEPLLLSIGITSSNAPEIYKAAYTYLFIITIGTFATMLYNQIIGVLRALGDSFVPFLFLVFSTILNIVLDLLFIAVFSWGVVGAAVATILSQFLAAFGSLIYALYRYKSLRLQKGDFASSWNLIFESLKMGLPLGLQFSILGIGIIVMQNAVIKFDIDPNTGLILASAPAQLALSVAYRVGNFYMAPFNALGTGMLSLVGQNYGAKKFIRVRQIVTASLIIGTIEYLLILVLGFCLTINGAFLYIFLTPDKITPEVINYANTYFYSVLPFEFFLMVLFILRNSIQGLEKPFYPIMAGIGELVGRVMICLFLPTIINGGIINASASNAAFVSVCFADSIAWVLSALILIYPTIKYIYIELPRKENYLLGKKDNNKNN